MLFAEIDARIRSAVDAVAAADANPSDPFRGLYISDDLARALSRVAPADSLDARVADAASRLELDPLESEVLALCAAPELSPRYGRLLAYLHDDVTRKLASPRLVVRLLGDDERSLDTVLACFARDRALRLRGAIRLLEDDQPGPLADRLVKVPDLLAAHLLGARLERPALDDRLRRVDLHATPAPGDTAAVEELALLLAADTQVPLLVAGPDAAPILARALGQGLLLLDAEAVLDRDAISDAQLSASLEQRRLCIERLENAPPERRIRIARVLAATCERPLIVADDRNAALGIGEHGVTIVETALPTYAERVHAWRAVANSKDASEVAAKFRLSSAQIATARELARLHAAGRGAQIVEHADVHAGARQASSGLLGELATRVSAGFGWDDLVLPERPLELLRSMSAYLRHRDLVLSQWGYERTVARSSGLKVLFAGESGTGKTMSAQVLAADLSLELFRIDLATVVSKYIGETEKNLDRIFAAAEGSNAILFFDEADALFGKRSEVSDSHDRYANIEVAYLLQKMESYAGAVILATNFRQNIDEAFLRRLDFVIDFPFPEEQHRLRIWERMLPDTAPVATELDLQFLARQFKLSGGGIRNCSLSAAFLAADDGGTITMEHLVRAVAIEYGKLGRLTLEVDFERFHKLAAGAPSAPKRARPQSATESTV